MRRSNACRLTPIPDEAETATDSAKFHSPPIRSSPPRHNQKPKLIFYTSLAVVLAVIYYMFVSSGTIESISSVKRNYGIVIDAGSTGTRIHVFKYEVRNGNPVFDFGEDGLASMKVNPGLSAYAEEPMMAAASIAELVEFGRTKVPREWWSRTEIRLMATAGLRLLESAVQERILNSCREFLRGSGFKFQDDWATVISGSDEGVYAWVVANYALGTLGGDPLQTTGIIELGGASVQVTFVSSEPIPPKYSRKIKFGNQTYHLYSHSLLQFGQNVAFDSLREHLAARGQDLAAESLQSVELRDPCTPRGYMHKKELSSPNHFAEKSRYVSALNPNGNFSECRSASLLLLQKGKEKCSHENCNVGSKYIPMTWGKLLATENFFHTSKFFGLAPKTFLSDLIDAGKNFCEEDWSELRRKYRSLEDEDLARYCFSSAYIVALLHDTFGISLDDERISYANQVENIPLDWALGELILQSTNWNDRRTC